MLVVILCRASSPTAALSAMKAMDINLSKKKKYIILQRTPSNSALRIGLKDGISKGVHYETIVKRDGIEIVTESGRTLYIKVMFIGGLRSYILINASSTGFPEILATLDGRHPYSYGRIVLSPLHFWKFEVFPCVHVKSHAHAKRRWKWKWNER
jgi:hypothetical protein